MKQRSDRGQSTALSRWDDRGHGSAQSVQVKVQLAVWPNTRTKRVGAIAGGLGLGAPPLRHAQWAGEVTVVEYDMPLRSHLIQAAKMGHWSIDKMCVITSCLHPSRASHSKK